MNDLVIMIVLPTLCLWVIDICEKVEKEEKRENDLELLVGLIQIHQIMLNLEIIYYYCFYFFFR